MIKTSWLREAGWKGFLFSVLLFTAAFSTAVGTYSSYVVSGNRVTVTTSTGPVRIEFCDTNIARISFDPAGSFTSSQDVLGDADLNRTWPAVAGFSAVLNGTTLQIGTTALNVRLTATAGTAVRLSFYHNGTLLTNQTAAMNHNGAAAVTLAQATNEHFFGWGAGFQWFRPGDAGFYFSLDNKGRSYSRPRSTAPYMYSTGPSANSGGYGLFFMFAEPIAVGSQWGRISGGATGAGVSFNLAGSTQIYGNSSLAMNWLSHYFIAGNWKQAIAGYTKISGRPPALGKKWYGIMRDMYFARGAATYTTMRTWADMFRNNRFNMDWIRMDNFYDWSNLGYLPTVPNPGCWDANVKPAIDYIRGKGFYFGGMNAGWTYYGCCSANCTQNLVEDVAHATTAVNNGYDWAWYDAMNFHSRTQSRQQWEVWLAAHGQDTSKVMISRGWQSLSSQSWPAAHMGDYLNQQWCVYNKFGCFPSALSEHLVGYAYSHTDLGENYDMGYVAFSIRPMYTIHMAGAAGGDAQNFQECGAINGYAADLKNLMHKWDNFHYALIPFFFSYGMVAHNTGVPIWRHMSTQNNGEYDASTYNLYMQCYVGEELITSPYFNDCPLDGGAASGWAFPSSCGGNETRTGNAARHNIYLPATTYGAWYDFFPAGAPALKYTAPTTIASYAVNSGSGMGGGVRANMRLPLFAKAGSIVPLMDTLLFIGERPETTLTVLVWPVGATTTNPTTGSFTLYEDETPRTSQLSYTFDGTSNTIVTFGAMSAGSKYCPTPANRHYRLQVRGLSSNAPAGGFQRPGTSGTWTTLPAITAAQWAAYTPGYYYDAGNSGIAYVNATLNGSATFQVLVGSVGTAPFSRDVLAKKVSVLRRAGVLEIRVPIANHTVEILNAQGRVVAKRSGIAAAEYRIPLGRQASAMYLVRIAAKGQSIVKRVTL